MAMLSQHCDLNMIIMRKKQKQKQCKSRKSIDSPKWWSHLAAFLGEQRSTLEDLGRSQFTCNLANQPTVIFLGVAGDLLTLEDFRRQKVLFPSD